MFHVELRHFPHNTCRFNLSAADLAPLLNFWAHARPVEIAGRTWDPRRARLTALEGPSLPDHVLSMGRGWSAAQRDGEDVTQRLLSEARGWGEGAGAPAQGAPAGMRGRAVARAGAAQGARSQLSVLL